MRTTSTNHWAVTPPPPRWCSNATFSYGVWESHIEPERVNVPQSHLLCGGDNSWREAGRWVHRCLKMAEGREWVFTSRARGLVNHCRWIVDLRADDALISCQEPVKFTHRARFVCIHQLYTALTLMEMMCEFISSQIYNSAKCKCAAVRLLNYSFSNQNNRWLYVKGYCATITFE